jgi:Kdo2-lipid IVA lauroyltransferase/acyltransferase
MKLRHDMRPAFRLVARPLQGLALTLFWACCAVMRPERAAAFGGHLGRALGPRSRRHRRLRNNLAIALPRATDNQLDACAQGVWGSFGATLAEYAHFRTIAGRAFDRHVEVVRHSGFDACRRIGRPCIFVTAHLGNWEVAAAAARHLGLSLAVVYSPQANPLTEWLVQRRRRHLRCRFRKADAGLRPLLQELRAGRSLGLLVDLMVKNGERVPFCGRDTTTTLVPARLALKVGCPLVPVRVERVRPAHLRVTVWIRYRRTMGSPRTSRRGA